jgi:hypothetical protein
VAFWSKHSFLAQVHPILENCWDLRLAEPVLILTKEKQHFKITETLHYYNIFVNLCTNYPLLFDVWISGLESAAFRASGALGSLDGKLEATCIHPRHLLVLLPDGLLNI